MLKKIWKKICRSVCLDGQHKKDVAKIKEDIIMESAKTQQKIEYANYVLKKTIAGDVSRAVGGHK